jgi:hypothetical protein
VRRQEAVCGPGEAISAILVRKFDGLNKSRHCDDRRTAARHAGVPGGTRRSRSRSACHHRDWFAPLAMTTS